jgi:hypothetical protein
LFDGGAASDFRTPELQMALICVNRETLTTCDAQESISLAVSDGDDRIVEDA